MIGGFRSLFFCCSEAFIQQIKENLYRWKFWQFTLSSRSIPNSVVWFLKISSGRKSQFFGRKTQMLFRIKSRQSFQLFGGYLLRFHLASDWSWNNKLLQNFLSGVHDFTDHVPTKGHFRVTSQCDFVLVHTKILMSPRKCTSHGRICLANSVQRNILEGKSKIIIKCLRDY